MGLLDINEESFDLKLIGHQVDHVHLAFVEYLVVDGEEPITSKIINSLLHCPLECFPEQFIYCVQRDMATHGYNLRYDIGQPIPAAREYFEICECSEYSDLQGFKVFWGDEELFKFVFPCRLVEKFETQKFKSIHYVGPGN